MTLPFANDGSFMERFRAMQEAQAQAAEAQAAGDAAPADAADATPSRPPPASKDDTKPQAAADAKGDAQAQGAAGSSGGAAQHGEAEPAKPTAAPAAGGAPSPAPASASKPAGKPAGVVLKAKKPIVQVRTRDGDVLQAGGGKRKKVAEGEDAAASGAGDPKSFYLRELERYRQVSCEGTGGGDRPLVK